MIEAARRYFEFYKEGRVPKPFTFGNFEETIKLMIKYERTPKDEIRQGDLKALRKARFELTYVAKNFGRICGWCETTENGSFVLIDEKHVKDKEFRAFSREVADAYYAYAKEVFQWRKELKARSENAS
jgi:hypothetical protein